MTTRTYILILLIGIFYHCGTSQHADFDVRLQAVNIPQWGGIQSYALGVYEGEWVILGGRLDGLHQRQPFAAFLPEGNNTSICVINPTTLQVWKRSVMELPTPIAEQLTSTNMEFAQVDDYLFLVGGYAYSPTRGDHITFPHLTAVNLPGLVKAIKNDEDVTGHFFTVEDDYFAVTGGRMEVIDKVFYLVGGQHFVGRYNPQGPNHGPGFFQKYTNAVKRFSAEVVAGQLNFSLLPSFVDSIHLHRRDYNLASFKYGNTEELVLYSGVFQYNMDVPYLYPVVIDENGYTPVDTFVQRYNHYHSANVSVYDAETEENSTIFFGGIAQFYLNGGQLVQDNNVPFVTTIAQVKRSQDGHWTEQVLDQEMPDYLGASAEFIPGDSRFFDGKIIRGEMMTKDFQEVGYILGGIKSSDRNIFFVNDGNQSEATSTIYKVSLRQRNTSGTNESDHRFLPMAVYPNPADTQVFVSVFLGSPKEVKIEMFSEGGQYINEVIYPGQETVSGENRFALDLMKWKLPQRFIVRVTAGGLQHLQKIIVE